MMMKLAISGMAVQLAGCPDLGTFQDILYRGEVSCPCAREQENTPFSLWQISQVALADVQGLLPQKASYLFPDSGRLRMDLPPDLPDAVYFLPAGRSWLFAVWLQAQKIFSEDGLHIVVAAAGDPALGGAAAVVLQRLADVRQAGSRVYAVIEEGRSRPTAGSLELDGQMGDGLAHIDPGLFLPLIAPAGESCQCALGSVGEILGCQGELAELLGLVKLGLSLHGRMQYAVPHWQGPHNPAAWKQTPFYVPADSRPWFQDAGAGLRQAVLVYRDSANELRGLTLIEEPQLRFPAEAAFSSAGLQLLPLQADSQAGLYDRLDQISAQLDWGETLPALAGHYLAQYDGTETRAYALGLVGSSPEELRQEISHARRGIGRAFETGSDWQSPAGSAFSAHPLGAQAGVAFVYPGGFNSHMGMLRDLFALFPRLQDHLAELTGSMDLSLQSSLLYPRTLAPLTEEQLTELDAHLKQDPIPMLTTGTAAAFLYTTILQEYFGLRPASAFGYSLGENSMMFAQGVWRAADKARNNLIQSPLFRSRLAGAQQAVRQHWGWPLQEGQLMQGSIWGNFVLMADPVKVQAALMVEDKVYLTHINAPRQVVIGGELQACKRVIASLKCMSLQAPYDYALHCEAMASEYARLEAMHTLPVESIPAPVLYTAADYHPAILDSALIAENIATALTNRLDFPRLVDRVYQDGARIFIEVGAGSNCSKWIGAILKDRPHAAMWVDQAKVDQQTMLVRLLAKLVSQGVPLDLSPLQGPQISLVGDDQVCLFAKTTG
jgi:PfaB family protein